MPELMTGGCQCGAVRFEARIENDDAGLCHCRMCQRAVGSVWVAFKNLKKADVRWTGREPDYYASSPIARRGHCAACGTSLTFEYPDSDDMDLTVGSFDEPGRFVPRHHFGIESRLDHWRDIDDLPGYRADQHQPLVARWVDKVGKLPG